MCQKLPELIYLNAHEGNWEKYLNAIYSVFKSDFIDNKPKFSKKVGLKKHPLYENKESTFWHFISDGKIEKDRIINIRRCERIAWPKNIIEAYNTNNVKIWRNTKNKNRIIITLNDFSYKVVLEDRGTYVLPWTAYVIEYKHEQKKLEKQYLSYIAEKAEAAKI